MTRTENSEDISSEPQRILGRSFIADYFSIDELPRKLGAEVQHFPSALLKELVENSLDSCEEAGIQPEIILKVNQAEGCLVLSCRDNGPGLDYESVKKITDYSQYQSSRHSYKKPSRGSLGNAYKCIIASPYATADALGRSPPNEPIKIVSRGYEYDIGFDRERQSTTITRANSSVSLTGTIVVLKLPILTKEWLREEIFENLLESFSIFNPHATFILSTDQGTKPIQYIATQPNPATREFRESIHWSSFTEFQKRLDGEIMSRDHGYRIVDFTRQYRGLSDKTHKLPVELLHELKDNPKLCHELYDWMRSNSENPNPDILSKHTLGKKHFMSLGASKYVVKAFNWYFEESRVYVPSIVEVAICPTEGLRQFIVGINRSPKVESPFKRMGFWVNNRENSQAIESILESNGIHEHTSVNVITNIVCPNPQYRDDGKTILNADPFHRIGQVVHDATKGFRRSRRRTPPGSPKNVKKAVYEVLKEAINIVSTNDRYRFKQRQLFYVLRQIFDKRYNYLKLSYQNLTQEILPEASRNGFDLRGMLKEANSELTEPRGKKVSLSTEEEEEYVIQPYKARCAIFAEKRGMIDLLEAEGFHSKYDVLLYGSQGQPSVATRVNLKRWEQAARERGEPFSIFCIHDADVAGYIIARTLRQPTSMMPGHRLDVVDLGLTMVEAVTMGLELERVETKRSPGKKREESRIPDDIVKELPLEEIVLLTGLNRDEVEAKKRSGAPLYERYRIELNQLTSEQFLRWLTSKLSSHGVLTKVRPPDEVVDKRTSEEVESSYEEVLSKTVLELCGVDDIIRGTSDSQELKTIDLKAQLSVELDKLPLCGWEDIVKMKARERVNSILSKPDVRQVIARKALSNLRRALD